MKPKITIDSKNFTRIEFPLEATGQPYIMQVSRVGTSRQSFAMIRIWDVKSISRRDARLFYSAMEILANRTGKMLGKKFSISGGRTKKEFNDGVFRIWDWEMNNFVIRAARNISFPCGDFAPSEAMQLTKQIGVANKINWWLEMRKIWWAKNSARFLNSYKR